MTAFATIAAPGAAPDAPVGGLSRRRKAALIVQLAMSGGGGLPLKGLPEEVQLDLTRELGTLRLVDRATLESVAQEFVTSLEQLGLSAPGGLDNVLAALTEHLSPSAAARMRNEVAVARGIDPWPAVLSLPPEELVTLMEQESTEVAAITLSKLEVAKAALILSMLPGPAARRITYAVSRTSGVGPDSVRRIGSALSTQYAVKPEKAFSATPVERVGAILNSSKSETREAVLAALAEDDPSFAEDVRRAIFTFKDIPARIAPIDVPTILRAVDNAVLVVALASARSAGGAEAEAADFLLENITQRLADSLRDEMAEKTDIRRKTAEEAWNSVVAAIRTRAEAGEITLIAPGEEEEDGAL